MPQWFYKSLHGLAPDYLRSKFTDHSYVFSFFLRDISGSHQWSRGSHFIIYIAVLDIILTFMYRNSYIMIEKVVQFSLNKELMS